MTVSAVTIETIELTVAGSTIDIAPFSGDAVPAGTQVSHGTRKTPLVQSIDAGATHISVADPGFASSLKAGVQILLRLATAITLTVIGMAASTIDIAPIGTDAQVPAGSLVTNANGTRTSPITQTIDSGVVVQQISVADQDFASSLSLGDTILLLTPSLRLDIESYEARLTADKDGCRDARRWRAAAACAGGSEGQSVRHPAQRFRRRRSRGPCSRRAELAIKTVEPASDIVALDDNCSNASGRNGGGVAPWRSRSSIWTIARSISLPPRAALSSSAIVRPGPTTIPPTPASRSSSCSPS
jgi:hypothetical protein